MAGHIAGLILAGGRSSRMGGTDKTLLELGGRPLTGLVLDRLQPQVGQIVINTNADHALFADFGVDVISDTISGYQGPLAGILAGLEWAADKPDVTHLLSVAGDTPFFPDDLARRLAAHSGASRGAVATSRGRVHPTFALWPVSLRDALATFLESGDTRRVMTFIEQAGLNVVDFPVEQRGATTVDPFFNINTPEDLADAKRLFGGAY
ncbi:molybdenum cofactor guanylyltransferase MobA [Aminobacter anthyllidis]|uniref:Molybdenum cofactor guanylyltransferase n=1 Tax=Aminobacter anthyllidis TaxID=1035067 RepID=A0A9X1D4H8_9HYPH|nr:molybdenum cofactor guanylyltransferase MobA [Aminobacter anthyllidis]MBT1154951.1 molybdenum cofactor guanylyltransferase MobA [Aminobacter anthyllidis]